MGLILCAMEALGRDAGVSAWGRGAGDSSLQAPWGHTVQPRRRKWAWEVQVGWREEDRRTCPFGTGDAPLAWN